MVWFPAPAAFSIFRRSILEQGTDPKTAPWLHAGYPLLPKDWLNAQAKFHCTLYELAVRCISDNGVFFLFFFILHIFILCLMFLNRLEPIKKSTVCLLAGCGLWRSLWLWQVVRGPRSTGWFCDPPGCIAESLPDSRNFSIKVQYWIPAVFWKTLPLGFSSHQWSSAVGARSVTYSYTSE